MTRSGARALCATSGKRIGLAALSGAQPVLRLARQHGTSRKWVRACVRAQRERARQAVDVASAEPNVASLVERFPRVSDAWERRFALATLLIAHGSYRRVIEVLRDLFGPTLCAGTIHTRVERAARPVAQINQARGQSRVRVGLHDEIFQGNQPVLAGVDPPRPVATCCKASSSATPTGTCQWSGLPLCSLISEANHCPSMPPIQRRRRRSSNCEKTLK